MATRTHTPGVISATTGDLDKHPRGLYVLFATEMWERFSFYTMGAMFTLYLQDQAQGFGWTADQATSLNSWYLAFVYFTPFIGGLLADWKLGYRRAVMIGGLFFMAGHLLLAVPSMTVMYCALACLVIGNGFFKPNVSTMVGNLYPEGSHLKDRAYNIFYMGINVGAFTAPIVAEFMKLKYGFHPAFAVAAIGMLLSVLTLWRFKKYVEEPKRKMTAGQAINTAAVSVDAPPKGISHQTAVENVPDSKRIGALLVIFLCVIVFWMVFHQNSSTLTYWAKNNTDWKVTGIISNAINPGWVLVLTIPLIFFWRWLDKKGKEPSTPTKMAIGMALTGLSFFVMYFAAKAGEAMAVGDNIYAYKVTPFWLIGAYGVLTLGELMLSPMGLSLVSKVSPIKVRGLMMGGWFVATAIGNKLTAIGVYWDDWLHSTFFAVLGSMALVMSVVLLLLLKPLKKAMPGV
jgi:proton-dependent oligopeptide transporter, POT family